MRPTLRRPTRSLRDVVGQWRKGLSRGRHTGRRFGGEIVLTAQATSARERGRLPLTVIEREEWGDPRDPEFERVIAAYSPYDNVRATAYPALYVTAGLNDPRVGYHEPAKWVAKLRATTTGDAPVLLRTELDAGHGGPSGRYDAWRDEAVVLSFVLQCVGLAGAVEDLVTR